MQLNIGTQMRMSQQMKLAPRMIQSMEILQLPLMALQERVEQELVENPVLDRVQNEDAPDPRDVEPNGELRDDPRAKEVERQELVIETDNSNAADFERLLEMSSD